MTFDFHINQFDSEYIVVDVTLFIPKIGHYINFVYQLAFSYQNDLKRRIMLVNSNKHGNTLSHYISLVF